MLAPVRVTRDRGGPRRIGLVQVIGLGLLLLAGASATLLAGSQLQKCVRDGTQPALETQLVCQRKFFITIALNNGQNNTESFEAVLASATDDQGNTVRLEMPMIIRLSKSQGIWNYPLDYRLDVNAKPTEGVVYVPNTLFVPRCVDSDAAEEPTCGWFLDNTGRRVPYSQGFCCACSFAQAIGADQSSTRAGLNCGILGGQSSGHCMRMDPLWYSVFGIGPVESSFEVRVELVRQLVSGETNVQTLVLSPSSTGAVNADRTVIAKLVGDFAAWTSPHVLSSKFLLNFLANSILVDMNRVTLDGTERNKIGVGFQAFRDEPNACNNRIGSSLGGQILDLVQEDLIKRANGVTGNYLLDNYGDPLIYLDNRNRRVLGFRVSQTVPSVVSLQIAADDVRFIVNRSPGVIRSAYANQFESLSKSGRLTVDIQNTGTVISDYEVTVTECSDGVAPVQSKQASLDAQEEKQLVFILRGEDLTGGNKQCTVRLLDSEQSVLDSVIVRFNTTDTSEDRGAQGGAAPDDSNRQFGNQTRSILGCSDYCPLLVDVPCFIVKGCWGNLGILVAILVAIIIFFVLLKRCACLRRCCCCCLCLPCRLARCCRKRSKKAAQKRKEKERELKYALKLQRIEQAKHDAKKKKQKAEGAVPRQAHSDIELDSLSSSTPKRKPRGRQRHSHADSPSSTAGSRGSISSERDRSRGDSVSEVAIDVPRRARDRAGAERDSRRQGQRKARSAPARKPKGHSADRRGERRHAADRGRDRAPSRARSADPAEMPLVLPVDRPASLSRTAGLDEILRLQRALLAEQAQPAQLLSSSPSSSAASSDGEPPAPAPGSLSSKSRVPRTRFTADELYAIAQHGGWVYCHADNDQGNYDDVLLHPGPQFCLLGRLLYNEQGALDKQAKAAGELADDASQALLDVDSEFPFLFVLDRTRCAQLSTFDVRRRTHVRLVPPRTLRADDFETELSEADALLLLAFRPRPGYVCVNEL